MSTSKTSYGAVEADENAAVDRSFDAESTYYLKESSNVPLTPRQRVRKLLSVGLPILIAALIMGGFAWFLLRDFNNLYPGRGGGSVDEQTSYDHVIPSSGKKSLDDATTPVSPTSKTDQSTGKHSGVLESSDAACAAHAACAKLDLVGNCCPTDKGTVLDCC